MAADHRRFDTTGSADERTRPDHPDWSDRTTTGAAYHDPPLTYRIERTRLRARIGALEQALETSEKRRRAVIEQYERLLSDRADATASSRSLLARLLDR
jgi:hypothetical protein